MRSADKKGDREKNVVVALISNRTRRMAYWIRFAHFVPADTMVYHSYTALHMGL